MNTSAISLKLRLFAICAVLLSVRVAFAQPSSPAIALWEGSGSIGADDPFAGGDDKSDKKKDPAADMYKTGYKAILNEEWEAARSKFSEMIKKYPKSEYVDDAEYWSAYALEHIDRSKARAAYERFLNSYPNSNYYDDAVAELDKLGASFSVMATGDAPVVVSGNGHGYSYSYAPTARAAKAQMRKMELDMARLQRMHPPAAAGFSSNVTVLSPRMPLLARAPGRWITEENIDPKTRLKMDALSALGETKEDSLSFKTLRDVATDVSQPVILRRTAMEVLSGFRQFEVLPIFVEVAKKDTSEEIQSMAIEYMGELSHNKNRSVEVLSDLFSAIPKHRTAQLQTVLGSIAEVGNDKAVDFLAEVARSNDDYDLRSDAVYYLGNIGGDRARAALYEILKGK